MSSLGIYLADFFIKEKNVILPHHRSAVRRAGPLCVAWAKFSAPQFEYFRTSEEERAQAKTMLVGYIKEQQYGTTSGMILWVIVSAVISFFVQWFLEWLFMSDANYHEVTGKHRP